MRKQKYITLAVGLTIALSPLAFLKVLTMSRTYYESHQSSLEMDSLSISRSYSGL